MGTYDAEVRNRRVRREHCLANGRDLEGIGRAEGQQVRIWRSQDCLGLYTVVKASLVARGTVGMGPAGRKRLRAPEDFEVVVDPEVVDQRRTDEKAAKDGEFVERLAPGRRRRLAVVAPHGGEIEEHTDLQAQRVAGELGSVAPWAWVCRGWGGEQGAFDRWHITSTDISPESFPLLARLLRKSFEHAISFHGFKWIGGPDVHIGGLANGDSRRAFVTRSRMRFEGRVSNGAW